MNCMYLIFSGLGNGWVPFAINDELDGLVHMVTSLGSIPNRRCWIGGSSNVANSSTISFLDDYRSDDLGKII